MDQELRDRAEIEDVLVRYGRAIDHDLDLWETVFTPDARLEYPASYPPDRAPSGERTLRTPAEMKEALVRRLAGGLVSQHLVSNVAVTITGDTATSHAESRAFTCLQAPDSDVTEIEEMVGHWSDVLVRTEVGWRISERRAYVRWTETRMKTRAPG